MGKSGNQESPAEQGRIPAVKQTFILSLLCFSMVHHTIHKHSRAICSVPVENMASQILEENPSKVLRWTFEYRTARALKLCTVELVLDPLK